MDSAKVADALSENIQRLAELDVYSGTVCQFAESVMGRACLYDCNQWDNDWKLGQQAA